MRKMRDRVQTETRNNVRSLGSGEGKWNTETRKRRLKCRDEERKRLMDEKYGGDNNWGKKKSVIRTQRQEQQCAIIRTKERKEKLS